MTCNLSSAERGSGWTRGTIFILLVFSTPSVSTLTPTVLPPDPTETSPTDAADTLVLGLERWEVGLVLGNVVVILSLLLCVCTMIVCVARRQRQSHRDPEHFLLKEIEDELVESPSIFACACTNVC